MNRTTASPHALIHVHVKFIAAALASALALVAALLVGTLQPRAAGFDSASAEAQLTREINADRAANGLGPLSVNPALADVARGGPHTLCGAQVLHGRSQDMIERGYFSHQVPPCGSLVWPVLAARGVRYTAAGENIAWNTAGSQSAGVDQANSQFMASPEHRANILGNYNQVGVGAFAAPGAWGYNGRSGAVVYTEIFVLGPQAAAPPAPRAVPPRTAVPQAPVPMPAPAAPEPPPPPAPPVPARPPKQLVLGSLNGCVQALDLARDGALWCSWQGAADSSWSPWVSPRRLPGPAAGPPALPSPWLSLWSLISGLEAPPG